MKTKLVLLLLLLALLASNGYVAQAAPAAAAPPPTVGAIFWAGWYTNPPNPGEVYLSPAQWHQRLPFFTQVIDSTQVQIREDSQTVIDQEIELAHAAGINYWAIDYNAPADTNPAPDLSDRAYGLHLYLSSAYKTDLNFALVFVGGDSMGQPEDWTTKTVPRIVQLLQEPTYQKVKGNRPLIYVFSLYNLTSHFGSRQITGAALQTLRDAATAAGLANPYMVGLVFHPQEAQVIRDLHLDAIGSYSAVTTNGRFRELSYRQLVQTNRAFWNGALKTGLKVVVSVNTGWDARPRMIDPNMAQRYGHSPYYTMATPAQIAAHLKNALNWSIAHRNVTEANTVLVYAWNEIDEGGWLLPTLDAGNARLQAIGGVLNAR